MLTHWRHMRPHHFSIVQTPPALSGRRVCVPELLAPFFSHGLPAALAPKAISRWGDDVELSSELVMRDASLLEDLQASNAFVLFSFGPANLADPNAVYWDKRITTEHLQFLGWNIANHETGDFAAADGCFPVQGQELAPDRYTLSLPDPEAANEWGLLKDQACLDSYLQKNAQLRWSYADTALPPQPMHLQAWAIFCDRHTFEKLRALKA